MTAPTALNPDQVSLVVPCYNTETYMEDFVASLVEQTWRSIQVILVNDGANDATTQALRTAVPRLKAEGFAVTLVEQENRGLAGAVNAGLQHVSGEFLMWPDPDDWLVPEALERHVRHMREHPNIGLTRANARLFIEARKEFDGHFMPLDDTASRLVPELFEELLHLRLFYAPVIHMARTEAWLSVYPNRTFWHERMSSQNFQMLVPLVEAFPVLQVPEVLACYRIRKDSRSRAPTKTPQLLMGRHQQLFDVTAHTLPRLSTYTPERAERVLNQRRRNHMLPTAIRAKLADQGRALIAEANLAPWRRAVARACLSLRCNTAVDALDARTGRIVSRVLARTFDAAVRMSARDAVWGAGPLWDKQQTIKEALQ